MAYLHLHIKLTRTPNGGKFSAHAGTIETNHGASASIAGELGIPADIPEHANYIADWLKKLRDDKREIFRVAADAQRMADWMLGYHPDFTTAAQETPHIPDPKAHAPLGDIPQPIS
ncbi:MAG: zincin-like metallopeptidase domain-containing protein [Bryobacteraceae bacterium]